MQLSLVLSALSALAGVSLAAPSSSRNLVNFAKRDVSDGASGAAYTGRLYGPDAGSTVAVGGNLTFSYDASAQSATPHYPASVISVDVGLQGPGPIAVNTNDFFPFGIVELATGLETGGPGGWVNASLPLTASITEPGEYFLIVTEHQREVYVEGAGSIRVQSYNRSITVTEA